MPTTSSAALRYPASSAAPNVPQDIQNLATDLDRKVTPNFATVAARTTAIPSPTQGQPAAVAGNPTMYDGTGWRSWRGGQFVNVSSDAAGLYTFSHGGPATPIAWGVSPLSQATDAINVIINVLAFSAGSTTLTARFTRSDTNAYLVSTTVSFSWWARF